LGRIVDLAEELIMTKDTLSARVLIADTSDTRFNATVERLPKNLVVRRCVDLEDLGAAILLERAAVVVIGQLGGGTADSLTAAYQVKEEHPSAHVIFIADSSTEALVLGALRAGVAEYLKAPLTGLEIADAIIRFLPPDADDNSCPELIGASPAMRELKAMIGRIARMNSTVLIAGDTGTGKEVVAGLLHRRSVRSEKPLVCVNCAAIPDTLLESELFGYEKGAFTGANARHEGQLKVADGGTLFLDEIGDMSLSAQAKILRAIEQHEVQPLGGGKPVPVNFRTLAATHHDLERLVAEGRFRSDLYFRIHVAVLKIPALRERPEDIPALARHFLRQINQEHGRTIEDFTPSAMRRLTSFHWPGNVRQLKNTIEAAALMCDSRLVSDANLRMLHCFLSTRTMPFQFTRSVYSIPSPKSESERLMDALQATNWNVTRTAELLSWSRVTVYRKVAKYELERNGSAAAMT
jgi:DNA-binding NtrC family response regulator